MKRYHVKIDDMVWPRVDTTGLDVEHTLRYGTREEVLALRYIVAGYVNAYGQMVRDPATKRARIVRALRTDLAQGDEP